MERNLFAGVRHGRRAFLTTMGGGGRRVISTDVLACVCSNREQKINRVDKTHRS